MTSESWSEVVVRPLLFGWRSALGAGLFYVSFILLMQIVLTNVIVAVLLEKMVGDDGADESEARAEHAGAADTKSLQSQLGDHSTQSAARRLGEGGRPLPGVHNPCNGSDPDWHPLRPSANAPSPASAAFRAPATPGFLAQGGSPSRGTEGGEYHQALHRRIDLMQEQLRRVEHTLTLLAAAGGVNATDPSRRAVQSL